MRLTALAMVFLLHSAHATEHQCSPLTGSVTGTPDSFEDDDTLQTSGVIQVLAGEAQNHNFNDATDVDWYAFAGREGQPYDITLDELGSSIGNESGAGSGVTFAIFDSQGQFIEDIDPLKARDLTCFGDELTTGKFPFVPARDGIYFIEVSRLRADVFGDDAAYRIGIIVNTAPDVGFLRITVQEMLSMAPISFAFVATDGNLDTLTNSSGLGLLADNPGSYSGMVTASGFLDEPFMFTLSESMFTEVTVEMSSSDPIFSSGFE